MPNILFEKISDWWRTLTALQHAGKPIETARGILHMRDLEVGHAKALIAFNRQLYRESDQLIRLPEEYHETPRRVRQRLDRQTSQDLMLGIFDGAQMVAHIAITADRRERRRHCAGLFIAVLADWQRLGLAHQLLKDAIDRARSRHRLERLELHVHASNAAAIALYRQFGFIEEGRRRRAIRYGDGRYVDDILMALDLSVSPRN